MEQSARSQIAKWKNPTLKRHLRQTRMGKVCKANGKSTGWSHETVRLVQSGEILATIRFLSCEQKDLMRIWKWPSFSGL